MTIQERIAEILKDRDSKTPMCRDILLDQLRMAGEDVTDREMRMIVAAMVTQGGIPVGTNTRGYFFVRTVEDLQAADGEMKAKQEAIQARRTALFNAYWAQHKDNPAREGQLGLFEAQAK